MVGNRRDEGRSSHAVARSANWVVVPRRLPRRGPYPPKSREVETDRGPSPCSIHHKRVHESPRRIVGRVASAMRHGGCEFEPKSGPPACRPSFFSPVAGSRATNTSSEAASHFMLVLVLSRFTKWTRGQRPGRLVEQPKLRPTVVPAQDPQPADENRPSPARSASRRCARSTSISSADRRFSPVM